MGVIKAVLFDLDGTLVDSAPDLCGAMNHVLTQRGHPALALEAVRHLVGEGGRALLARGLWGVQAQPPEPEEDAAFDEAVSAFLAYYRDHLTDHSHPYPGAVTMLQRLAASGTAMGVVTNKPEQLARRMLAQLHLLPFFVPPHATAASADGEKGGAERAVVVGGDTLLRRKPDPEPLLSALAQLGLPPERAVMVGDSITDVRAARAAGCPVVWMSHGYHRGLTAEQLQPDWVLDHFESLPSIVRPACQS